MSKKSYISATLQHIQKRSLEVAKDFEKRQEAAYKGWETRRKNNAELCSQGAKPPKAKAI